MTAERILVTCSRPQDALALLDEISALRHERDRVRRSKAFEVILNMDLPDTILVLRTINATLTAERDALQADRDANAYVLQIAREEAKTNLEAKHYWEERADAALAALDRITRMMDEHCTGTHMLEHCCVAFLRNRLGEHDAAGKRTCPAT